jgi:hypothetical protein
MTLKFSGQPYKIHRFEGFSIVPNSELREMNDNLKVDLDVLKLLSQSPSQE